MANKGALTAAAAILLLVLVLFQAIPTEAARRMAQAVDRLLSVCPFLPLPPRLPPICPACVCCSSKPLFGCCSCCAEPVEKHGSPHP
ncbi:unnamed protein product [Spirodela intermedia]|uniref:Uncharacterized protein n=1 Tax=Spirodela intermedia TaxID=51605 RepID=A0A7I8IW14_SPIIN|nr:unnamed protein product [Spirodela intermedia]CAA6662187.1 unnamed protein product [Spirodela intermedia]